MSDPQFAIQVAAAVLGFAALAWVLTKGYLLVGVYLTAYAARPLEKATDKTALPAGTNCAVNAGPAACNRLTLLAGAVFLLTFILGQSDPLLVISVPLAMLVSLSAYVDYYTQKLPDRLTVLAAFALLTGLGIVLLVTPVPFPLGLLYTAALGALVWVFPLAVIYFGLKGLGLGDLKLAPVLGAWLGLYGFEVAYTGLLLAFLLGGVTALVLMAMKKLRLKDWIAYGPFLVLGAYLAWALHVTLL